MTVQVTYDLQYKQNILKLHEISTVLCNNLKYYKQRQQSLLSVYNEHSNNKFLVVANIYFILKILSFSFFVTK